MIGAPEVGRGGGEGLVALDVGGRDGLLEGVALELLAVGDSDVEGEGGDRLVALDGGGRRGLLAGVAAAL